MQRFLADASHEIRTPLTALRGYSALYERGMLHEPGALDRAMNRIGQESTRLHDLVDNMLQLARNRKPHAPIENIDTAHIIHNVASDLRSAHPTRQLNLDIPPASDHTIQASAASIHQAILNLASNAYQHTTPDTIVTINMRCNTNHVTIQVIDHGPGIDPEHATHIFLPFFQLDTSRSRTTNTGTGLGLALTKQITDHHHGALTLTTTPGGGATFTLTLPRSQPHPTEPTHI